MNWILTDIAFRCENEPNLNGLIFTITQKQAWMERHALKPILDRENKPEDQKVWLENYITEKRPELTGCQVVGVHLNLPWMTWEIFVMHESLPEIPLGSEIESVPLLSAQKPSTWGEVKKAVGYEESWRDKEPLL